MKYKMIVRDPQNGTEQYYEERYKSTVIKKAIEASKDKTRHVYVEWTDTDGKQGYMNRDGDTNCPGEPW